jgi:hypothetical protein
MYDVIFHALSVEGDVLLSKPFLDLGCDGVVRGKSPASGMFLFAVYYTRGSTRGLSRI